MAGLFAAAFLHSRGWQVDVYERGAELADRGAGIVTHEPLYAALRAARIRLRPDMGIPSSGREMLAPDGSSLGTYDMAQLMTSWGLIYRFLQEQIPAAAYHLDHHLENVREGPQSVTAHFANGECVEADWLIGADGAQSTLRGLLAPEVAVNYCGYYIWRGLIDETLIPAEVLERMSGRLVFGMAPGGHCLGYLVAGKHDELEVGRRRYNWAWYRSGDESTLRELLTDESGRHHAAGIPHPLIRRQHRDAMRDEAAEFLAPQFQAIIAATESPFLQAIHDLGCERLVYGRTILIGDAAFTARPHVGMGVTKAADDAATLAETLTRDPSGAALPVWERARAAYGRAVLEWGRDLGSYLGPAPRTDTHRAKATHYQQPEVLMSVTAATDPSPYLEPYLNN